MISEWCTILHLVKSEDLNHHGTLFAGRMSEWFVEGSFIAAASFYGDPSNIVCLKIHGMKFLIPANKGEILQIKAKVARLGKTSIAVYCQASVEKKHLLAEGFCTFVCVDSNGKKMPHNLILDDPESEEDKRLFTEASVLK